MRSSSLATCSTHDFEDQQRLQAQKIVKLLPRSNCPVFYIMGNDDNVGLDYEDALITSLHDKRVEFDGYNFVGYQYTPPFAGETFVKEDSEIAADLRLLGGAVDRRTILVTHTPAHGSLDLCNTETSEAERWPIFCIETPCSPISTDTFITSLESTPTTST